MVAGYRLQFSVLLNTIMRPNPQPLPYWGRRHIQSLSPHRREVWREVYVWSIHLKIAVRG